MITRRRRQECEIILGRIRLGSIVIVEGRGGTTFEARDENRELIGTYSDRARAVRETLAAFMAAEKKRKVAAA
jgi:hypothetical protein